MFAYVKELYRFKLVTYYTIQLEEAEFSLFQEFLARHSDKSFEDDVDILRTWIQKVGGRGARPEWFRHEGAADALPPPPQYLASDAKTDMRLYCIRFNRSIVFLLNGGVKTSRIAQECPNVSPYFAQANRISKALDQAVRDGDVELDADGRSFLFDENFMLEI